MYVVISEVSDDMWITTSLKSAQKIARIGHVGFLKKELYSRIIEVFDDFIHLPHGGMDIDRSKEIERIHGFEID